MIKRIAVKNFKSLLDVTVDLAPVTVLAGRSGSGKTNFVQAIELLRTIVTRGSNLHTLHAAMIPFGGPQKFRPANLKQTGFTTEFRVSFDVPGYDGDFDYHLAIEFDQLHINNIRVLAERLSLGNKTIYYQAKGNWITKPSLAQTSGPEPLNPGNVLLSQLTSLPDVNIAYISLAQSMRTYNFPGNVLAENGMPGSTGLEVLNSEGSNARRIVDGIVGSIKSLPAWREIEASLKQLSAALIGITVKPSVTPESAGELAASFKLGDAVASIGIQEQSEGFRRFLAHLLAIYQNVTQQVIIFEEPEKGIFPGALSLLAEHIKSANEKLGTQLILTTHSPQLLDAFPGESIRWVRFSDHGTKIFPLPPADLIAIREGLMAPGEVLTVADPEAAEPANK